MDRIFRRVDCEERGFDAALAVLRPGHRYTRPRLEGACAMVNLNLPRFRLHPYAAILTAPSIFLASNSAGLRLPRAEWIPTLL